MRKVNIALIDTGVDSGLEEFENVIIEHIDVGVCKEFSVDSYGHGTSIAFILTRNLDVKIYSIKIFEENKRTTENDYIKAFEFICNNLDVDFIHISSGVTRLSKNSRLNELCSIITSKGVGIVSAFANQGAKSYPASFDNVIGVHWSMFCLNVNDYIFVENSPVDIQCYAGRQLLLTKGGEYKYISGSSFSSAYITKRLARELVNNNFVCLDYKDFLLNNATDVIKSSDRKRNRDKNMKTSLMKIKKAIIFPVNKETHSLLGNSDLVNMDIVGVYDVKHLGNIGKRINEVAYGKCVLDGHIEDYLNIDWEDDFDTVVIGHTIIIEKALNIDMIKYFIEKCISYKKNAYFFDSLEGYDDELKRLKENGNFFIDLSFNNSKVDDNSFGSLNNFSVPIVSVVGTSSKQGKFNIQLELRRLLKKDGYNVGQLGTEPASYLFGMDLTHHVGFNGNKMESSKEEIYYLNTKLYELNSKDIILTGTQSQTIPYTFGNINFYPLTQQNILLSCPPDIVILAVNFTDKIGYISRTINYIENFFGAHVLGIVLFPFYKDYKCSVQGNVTRHLENGEISNYKSVLFNKFGKLVYLNGNNEDMELLYDNLINYFM